MQVHWAEVQGLDLVLRMLGIQGLLQQLHVVADPAPAAHFESVMNRSIASMTVLIL